MQRNLFLECLLGPARESRGWLAFRQELKRYRLIEKNRTRFDFMDFGLGLFQLNDAGVPHRAVKSPTTGAL
jgi:hypothetical protein